MPDEVLKFPVMTYSLHSLFAVAIRTAPSEWPIWANRAAPND